MSSHGTFWLRACHWVCWVARDPFGSLCLLTSPAQLLLSEKSSVAARRPSACRWGHCGIALVPHALGYGGMHKAGLEARAGEDLDPIISPIHGWPRLLSCSLASLLPPAPLVLLLSRSLGAASWGASHPQGQCKDNTGLVIFGEIGGVCEMPRGIPSPTAYCEGGL